MTMRPAFFFSVLSCLFAAAGSALAEPEPYNAVIRVPEVQVRSGPSPQYYATSLLRIGEEVRVIKEEDGWLFIVPPSDSFSWVKDLFIGPIDSKTGAATTLETAEVRVGSALHPEKRDVTKVKLSRGSLVVVLDEKRSISEDGSWLKIQPPPNEYRYIPADAVKTPAPKVEAVNPPPSGPPPALGGPVATQPPPGGPGESLWYRAEQAERAGNPAEAERLFLQLAHETPDHDLQMRCYNRIHFLREGRRTSYPAGYQPRLTPAPGYPYGPSTNPYMTMGRATSQYTYAPIPNTSQALTPSTSSGNCQWSGWGWLRRAPFWVDNKQAYVLENNQGMPRLYVTAQPGVNLESSVNKTINLYGKMVYRGDLRTNYMTACQLAPLP
jgi:SH3-like domain-containing protein